MREAGEQLDTAHETAITQLDSAEQAALSSARSSLSQSLSSISAALAQTMQQLAALQRAKTAEIARDARQARVRIDRDAAQAEATIKEQTAGAVRSLRKILAKVAAAARKIPAPSPTVLEEFLGQSRAHVQKTESEAKRAIASGVGHALARIKEQAHAATSGLAATAQQGARSATSLSGGLARTASSLLASASSSFNQLQQGARKTARTLADQTAQSLRAMVKQATVGFQKCLGELTAELYKNAQQLRAGLREAMQPENAQITKNAEEAASQVQPRWKGWVKIAISIVVTVVVSIAITALAFSGVGAPVAILLAGLIGAAGGVTIQAGHDAVDGKMSSLGTYGRAALAGAVDGLIMLGTAGIVKGLSVPGGALSKMSSAGSLATRVGIFGAGNTVSSMAFDGIVLGEFHPLRSLITGFGAALIGEGAAGAWAKLRSRGAKGTPVKIEDSNLHVKGKNDFKIRGSYPDVNVGDVKIKGSYPNSNVEGHFDGKGSYRDLNNTPRPHDVSDPAEMGQFIHTRRPVDAPDAAEMEYFAHKLAYQKSDEFAAGDMGFLKKNGYERLESLDGKWGLRIHSFTSKNKAPIVVVRGTVPNELKTISADLNVRSIGLGQFNKNRAEIERILNTAIETARSQGYKGDRVIVTGHSLGGAMAQTIAAKFPHKVLWVETFQAPGIMKSLVAKLEAYNEAHPDQAIKSMHHKVIGDPVPWFGAKMTPGDTRVYEGKGSKHGAFPVNRSEGVDLGPEGNFVPKRVLGTDDDSRLPSRLGWEPARKAAVPIVGGAIWGLVEAGLWTYDQVSEFFGF